MYDRILLATDGNIASEEAETHALDLAEVHDAVVHALYIVDETIYSAYSGDEYVDEVEGPEHTLVERGHETLGRLRTRADEAGVDLVDSLQHGQPVERILAYADDHDVDVIVLGSRRRPAEYRSILGGVTDRVLRLTARPTIVVKTAVAD